MSAYKTVNKRADPKRNFTASLACSGYSGKSKKRRAREREIEAGFGEIKEGKTDESCARKGKRRSARGRIKRIGGNRENERNRRTRENKSTSWPPRHQ